MAKSKLLSSALGAAFVAAAFAATPAMALEAKQCLSMPEMNAALKAEGQHTMIIGDRLGKISNDASRSTGIRVDRFANAVTSNADGSVGYELEGDLPRAQTSTSMCVAAKLTNIRFFDAAHAGIPSAAMLGGRIDDMLKADETVGARPMVVADTLHTDASGVQRIGLPMVLTGNVPYRVGSIYARQSNGEPILLTKLGDLEYTPAGLERARGTALASLNLPKAP